MIIVAVILRCVIKNIWNGERHIMFVGDEIAGAYQKTYKENNNSKIPNQKDLEYEDYVPKKEELTIAKNTKKVLEQAGYKNYIYRADFIDDDKGNIMLLEFEMVNPELDLDKIEDISKNVKSFIDETLLEQDNEIEL